MKKNLLSLMYFLLLSLFIFGQTENKDVILENFQSYTNLPREIAYTHLNKDTFITGEDIAFKVYLFDKPNKSLSEASKIIYCTLEDLEGKILKKQMLYSQYGFTNGIFEIDSSFQTGDYLFKAYTNWMRNFDELNGTASVITILNPEQNESFSYVESKSSLDVQFLPEGGHLVLGAKNNVGVAIKDNFGKGVSNLYGVVFNQRNEEIARFTSNEFGFSKFELEPKPDEDYRVEFQDFPELIYKIKAPKQYGINVSFNELNDKLMVHLRTNKETLPELRDKDYKLSIHNGSQLKYIDIGFNQELKMLKVLNKEDLYPGVNIFTLFNDENKPVLERLYFNYNGLKTARSKVGYKVLKTKDSVRIRASFEVAKSNDSLTNSISVSILPVKSICTASNETMLSKVYLEPYLNSSIEEVGYYFGELDNKLKSSMDLLLLNQGWSSYDWSGIFKNVPKISHKVESGIEITANGLDPKTKQLVIYPMKNTREVIIDIDENQKNAAIKGLVPMDGEALNLSVVNKKGKTSKPNLYIQFKPTAIPNYNSVSQKESFREKIKLNLKDNISERTLNNQGATALDEVIVNAKAKVTRLEKLKQRYHGSVDVFDKIDRASNINIFSYLSSKGYTITTNRDNPFQQEITLPRRISLPKDSMGSNMEIQKPLIYLDNQLLFDQRFIQNFDMSLVDYIVVDKQGLGEGMRGAAGVIRIFTDPYIKLEPFEAIDIQKSYEFPLTFAKPKKFYIPLYNDYSSDFFNRYGVIDWKPDLSINSKGQVDFQIKNQGYSGLMIIMEGVDNAGNLISKVKQIKL